MEFFTNINWFYLIAFIVYSATIISATYVVISENRNPVRSLAWVTVLLFLPVIGLIFYLFFGRNIKNNAVLSKRVKRKIERHEKFTKLDLANLDLNEASKQQIKLGQSLAGAIYHPANNIQIFAEGRALFDALIEDIKNAKYDINIQFYIFTECKIGNTISELLIKKAKEGVKVRVIYDHVGNFRVSKKFYRKMSDAGIEVYPFFKVSFPEFATRVNWRNHRKITVIDNEIGYIGGMNIADRYIDDAGGLLWRDTHIRITGPSIAAMNYSFALDWAFMGLPPYEEREVEYNYDLNDKAGIQIVSSGPFSQWHNIALMFQKAISNAKKCIYIQTPYFLPTESLLSALQTAALAKVDVRIMIPRKPDSATLKMASGSYIGQCLKSGIKIYYYEPGMLHSKTIVIDDEFSTTGSTNFDFRSMEYNFECNAFIYSKEVNQQMKDLFDKDLEHSTRVTARMWRHRPFTQKLKESCCRLLSPVL